MRVDFRARHTATSIHCGIPTVAVHSDMDISVKYGTL